jgi:hypothetical protein
MTHTVYAAILQPFNQCSLMGVERVVKSEVFIQYRITVSVDNFKQYRAVVKCRITGDNIAAILFDNSRTVLFKYTVEPHRNKQLTGQLFAYTEMTVKKSFYHSDNLTASGAASIA